MGTLLHVGIVTLQICHGEASMFFSFQKLIAAYTHNSGFVGISSVLFVCLLREFVCQGKEVGVGRFSLSFKTIWMRYHHLYVYQLFLCKTCPMMNLTSDESSPIKCSFSTEFSSDIITCWCWLVQIGANFI